MGRSHVAHKHESGARGGCSGGKSPRRRLLTVVGLGSDRSALSRRPGLLQTSDSAGGKRKNRGDPFLLEHTRPPGLLWVPRPWGPWNARGRGHRARGGHAQDKQWTPVTLLGHLGKGVKPRPGGSPSFPWGRPSRARL